MRVLVVDDEEPARARLVRMLERIDGVEVVGEAANGVQAVERIEALAPEVLLLDIEMPGLDGLSVAAKQRGAMPVIFITAHDEHAVRAFELSAVDYLLKPVTQSRLVQAIERARARVVVAAAPAVRVTVHENGVARFFDASMVERFRASQKYTAFDIDGVEHLTEESLSSLETRLASLGFVRVHRAELVRLSAVTAIGAGELHLQSGATVPVSKRLAAQVRQQLKR